MCSKFQVLYTKVCFAYGLHRRVFNDILYTFGSLYSCVGYIVIVFIGFPFSHVKRLGAVCLQSIPYILFDSSSWSRYMFMPSAFHFYLSSFICKDLEVGYHRRVGWVTHLHCGDSIFEEHRLLPSSLSMLECNKYFIFCLLLSLGVF